MNCDTDKVRVDAVLFLQRMAIIKSFEDVLEKFFEQELIFYP